MGDEGRRGGCLEQRVAYTPGGGFGQRYGYSTVEGGYWTVFPRLVIRWSPPCKSRAFGTMRGVNRGRVSTGMPRLYGGLNYGRTTVVPILLIVRVTYSFHGRK